MSKYTLIERELSQINDAKFQTVCNAFLQKEYEGDIHSPGTVIAKEKTRRGKPDAFLLREDGKILLAEYTTLEKGDSKEKFYSKLEKDLQDCLDFPSLGIDKKDVSKIVLCCNSIVETSEIASLRKLTDEHGINLRIVSIQTLALHFLHNRYSAHELLNIPFDTGQLLSKMEFLRQYSKRNFSTPLDNEFVGRDRELEDIIQAIAKKSVTIIKGAPGVGKSRLVMHSIDEYVKENPSFVPYYFVKKSGSVVEDLLAYIEPDRNYIFFLDDANRQLENLLNAINSLIEKKKGEIKIIVTVRDYAKEEIIRQCREFNPYVYSVGKLSDDTISAILRGANFNIVDSAIVERIIEVSKGNPRLAIMSARIIKRTPDVSLLQDVTKIYEEYFQNIIDDQEIFANKDMLKVVGLISFLHTIDLEEEEEKEIVSFFGLSYGEFIDIVHQLEAMEIVEVYMNYTIKMSEQVMSTYFFYKTFFKDQLLNFSNLLNRYFKRYHWRFRDSFDPANSAFGNANVLNLAKEDLQNFYKKVKTDATESLQFLRIFGKYLPNSTFQYVDSRISEFQEQVEIESEIIKSKGNANHFDFDNLLEILEPFYKSDDEYEVKLSVELSAAYIVKRPFLYGLLLKKLTENFQLTESDLLEQFKKQQLLFQSLKRLTETRKIFFNLFYDVFSNLLLNRYYDDSFYTVHEGRLIVKEQFQDFRNEYWEELINDYDKNCDLVMDVFINYLDTVNYARAELIKDVDKVTKFFEEKLSPEIFGDCYLVNKYVHGAQERGVRDARFKSLVERFSTECYRIFSSLTWDKLDIRELHVQFGEWEKVEKYKCEVLSKELPVSTIEEFDLVYNCIQEIMNFKYRTKFELASGLDSFFSSLIDKSPILGMQCLTKYLNGGNIARLWPGKILSSIFSLGQDQHLEFYQWVDRTNFSECDTWMERYFYFLPEHLVSAKQAQNLINFFRGRTHGSELHADSLDKFLSVEPRIYEIVLQNEVQKRKVNTEYHYKPGYNFFKKNKSVVENNFALCQEAYFQQLAIDTRFDNDSEDLFILFEKNNDIIYEIINFMYQKGRTSFWSNNFKSLVRIWEYPNAEELIYSGLLKLKSLPSFYVSDHMAATFFVNLDKKFHDRAFELLCKIISNFSNDELSINMVLDIARNCVKSYYYKLIQHFLSVNDNFEFFTKIQLNNNHFSSSGNEIWADFKAAELNHIYNAIRELPDRRRYLLHLELLEREIAWEEKDAVRERKARFREFR